MLKNSWYALAASNCCLSLLNGRWPVIVFESWLTLPSALLRDYWNVGDICWLGQYVRHTHFIQPIMGLLSLSPFKVHINCCRYIILNSTMLLFGIKSREHKLGECWTVYFNNSKKYATIKNNYIYKKDFRICEGNISRIYVENNSLRITIMTQKDLKREITPTERND